MEFLTWHYTSGLKEYIENWRYYFKYINHYFTPRLLLKTLFLPWKRLILVGSTPGLNIQKKIEVSSFNLISRGIGAIARLTLVVVGILLYVLAFFGGMFGLILWVLIPLVGLPAYNVYRNRPQDYISRLMKGVESSNKESLDAFLSSEAGIFITNHLGVGKKKLIKNARDSNPEFLNSSFTSLEHVVSDLMNKGLWAKDFLRKHGITKKDFILAAIWFDKVKNPQATDSPNLGRAGLARELLFGYTPNLNNYSTDLSSPLPFSDRLIGREELVSRMERTLTAGNSIVLTGQPGVGKKTVVLEFAHRAVTGQLGKHMSFKRMLELDHNSLLSESIDVNKKKTKLAQILAEAAYAGNVILMIKDIQRLTHPDVEGYDFTDVFEKYLEKRDLKIIAVTTPAEYERFIAPNMRLRKYLKTIEITPPDKKQALEILLQSARNWESKKNISILLPSLRKILDESDRYITEAPFPEKALEILDSLIVFADEKGKDKITPDDVNEILAEKTGISFARLTKQEKKRLGNLEEIIHKRLINQDSAVNFIAKSLRARTVGAKEDARPIGSFLFLGPTGVGKTETAKVLAQVYYGTEDKIIRFDMAEYAGKEGLERLIGSQTSNTPGKLTTEVKNNPASLLLLDELEKATPEIYNLFLTLLDEGSMTDAFGKKINGRHLFVIGTSNAGAEFIRQKVSKGLKGQKLHDAVIEYVLEHQYFSPEFLNRFDAVIVYEPLGKEELIKIAHLMLERFVKNIRKKGIKLQYSPSTAEKLAEDGYNPSFGARPMRRIVDLALGDLIGKAILAGDIKEGDTAEIIPGDNKEEFFIKKI